MPYATISRLNHNDKGNPLHLKAALDADKANDLRTNHFSIGGGSANVASSVHKLGYRPSSAVQMKSARPFVDQRLKDDLRATHWGPKVAARHVEKRAQFVTSNMLNFKWYQPTAIL